MFISRCRQTGRLARWQSWRRWIRGHSEQRWEIPLEDRLLREILCAAPLALYVARIPLSGRYPPL